jgi:hypothetical protein
MQDNTTKKNENKHPALSGIPTYDVSVQAIKDYASDRADIGTDKL